MARNKKKYTYPVAATLKKDGKVVHTVDTQLYRIGIYIMVNNNPANQSDMSPEQVVKYMKQFKQDNLNDGVTVEFAREITVHENEDGFWEEVVNQEDN